MTTPDHVTYVRQISPDGRPVLGRAPFDDPGSEALGALAVVPLTDAEHSIATARLGVLGDRFGLTERNAAVLLSQAAGFAVATASQGETAAYL